MHQLEPMMWVEDCEQSRLDSPKAIKDCYSRRAEGGLGIRQLLVALHKDALHTANRHLLSEGPLAVTELLRYFHLYSYCNPLNKGPVMRLRPRE